MLPAIGRGVSFGQQIAVAQMTALYNKAGLFVVN
jgi:hypothetical protein